MRLKRIYPVILLFSSLSLALAGCGATADPAQNLVDVNADSTANGVIWSHENRQNKDVVLLVHGWNGDKINTWSQLIRLFLTDESLSQYDIATFGYSTGCFFPHPGVVEVAEQLDDFITKKLKNYDRVHIVAHSLGGLAARRYIVDVLKKRGNGSLRVEHLLLLGTPNEGARWFVTLVGSIFCGRQASQAARTSDFISELRVDWIKHVQNGGRQDLAARSRKNIPTLGVVASDDILVERRSASSYLFDRDVRSGHTEMKELKSHADATYIILANYLRSKSFPETSVSDWQPSEEQKKYFRNWRESIRLLDGVVLKNHAATTRWTYVFVDLDVYVFTEKAGYLLPSRGFAQNSQKIGVSYERIFVYDKNNKRLVNPRERKPTNANELPFFEVDIGDNFDLLIASRASKGKPFCRSSQSFGLISAINNTEIVEGYEIAIYAGLSPTYIRPYYLDDEYKPWLVSGGQEDTGFRRLLELKNLLMQIQPAIGKNIDTSKLNYGRVYSLLMTDTRDTYLLKFSCDIFPGE